MASILLDVPTTMVALLEASKKKHNCLEDVPEPLFLIAHLINNFQSQSPNDILIIENVYQDERTKDLCVDLNDTSPPFIAIAPLIDGKGQCQGFLYFSDTHSRHVGPEILRSIKTLTNLIASSITVENHKQNPNEINSNIALDNFSVNEGVETNNISFWKLEIGTDNFYVTPKFSHILGYTPAELDMRSLNNWMELIYPWDSHKFSTELELWCQNNQVYKELEFRMFHKNGQIIWIHFSATKVLRNESGLPVFVEGEIFEVTSQKKVWDQIDFISPKLTSVIQSGYNWLSIIDNKGYFTYVSTSSGLAMGFPSEDLYGKNYFNFIHNEEREKALYNFNKFIKGAPFASRPFRFKHKDGSWRWIEVLLFNLSNDPEIQGIVVIAREITDKISLSHNLKSSQENQRLLFNSSPLPKYLLDLGTYKILEVNDTMVKCFGYSRQELIGMDPIRLKPKTDSSVFIDAIETAKSKKGTNRYGLFTHQSKTGELSQLELVGYSLTVRNRDCILISCIDVSERELYLNGLKRSERQLKKAAAIAKFGYWSMELNDNSISWSEEMYTIWERNNETFKPDRDNFLTTVHPDDRFLFSKRDGVISYKNQNYDLTYRIILPDGSTRWVHEISQLVLCNDGLANIMEGTVQDVTEQKENEQHLRLIKSAISDSKDAVMIIEAEPIDLSGRRIIYVNQTFTTMTGYASHEVLGKTTAMLNGPNTVPLVLNGMEKLLNTGKVFDVNLIRKNKIGEQYWVNLTANPLKDENGKPTHWVFYERDITVKKNSQLQKEVLDHIGNLFNSDHSLEFCLENVVTHLIDRLNYNIGQIWLPSSDKKNLTLAASYSAPGTKKSLIKGCRTLTTCYFGEALPGTVWKNQEIIIWESIEKEKVFAGSTVSDTSCSQAFTGFPLIYNGKVKGILILGMNKCYQSPIFYSKLFKQLQTKLAETIKRKRLETELDQIFKFTPDIICKIGEDGFFKKINPAATKLLGYSEEELLSKKIMEFVHPKDREKTLKQLKRLYLGHPLNYYENRYITKGGQTKWLSWTANLTHEKGITYAVAKDITEKKEMKELLKDVSNLSRIGAWEINFENGTVYWSEMTKKIHEVDNSYKPNLQSILGFYKGPENTSKFSEAIDNAFHQDGTFDLEMPIITAKGKERWVRVIGNPEFLSGQCIRIYGSFQDIHELKTSQLDYIRTNDEKNAVLESIGDAFISLTKEGVITYWNKKAEDSFGIDREKVLEKHIEKVFPKIIEHEIFVKIIKSVKSNSQFTFVEYFPSSNKWYEINAYPSSNGHSIYIKDVSERLKAEKEIRLVNERFTRVVQASTDAIWDWEIVDNTLFLSDTYKTLFGHEINVNSKNLNFWIDQLHPDDKVQVVDSFYKVIEDVKTNLWESEYRFLKATGEYAYVWDKGTVIRDQNGIATRVVGAMTDISFRKTYEKSLEKLNCELEERAQNIETQNKKLREIAWTQSHIVRAPLARLMGLVGLIRDELVTEQEKMELLDHIYDSATEFDIIIRDIVSKTQTVVENDE